MSFFACSKCLTIDCFELTYGELNYKIITPEDKLDLLCHECKNGTWHKQFEKNVYDPNKNYDIINKFEIERESFNIGLS